RGDDALMASTDSDVYLFGDDGSDDYAFGPGASSDVVIKEILTLDKDTIAAPSQSKGADKIDLSAFSSASINLGIYGSTTDVVTGKQSVATGFQLTIFGSFEEVIGTPGSDLLMGNSDDNLLIGGGGDDTIKGMAGNDTIEGDAGNDSLEGGSGDDTY